MALELPSLVIAGDLSPPKDRLIATLLVQPCCT
jgi:hypothetical protein